ncbi:helix-turn-helix transcriptional regulator [Streptomyces glomeratus]|uniref:helix-turn-helix transcriptional regulator n=1 Tax=Streptomyces glomeratus TaxID=284452 RepID=UPI001F38FC2A|nr:LuxR family transcriptional regulator [Streptomyces glomeratus]MCF1512183.1 AAA family ATPase [Streptomyces glomeratus]
MSRKDTALYEREKQLALLLRLLQDSLRGNTRLAVVSGAPGHGKTELLAALAEEARRAGAVHFSATASRAEQAVPFGVLAQLSRGVDLPRDMGIQMSRLLNQALSAVPGSAATPQEPGAVAPRLFHQMGTVLYDLVESIPRPLLISVDDVQFADTASLLCLSTLVRRRRSTPLLLILNEHPSPLSSSALLKAELPPEPLSHQVRLPPLSKGGVAALVAECLGEPAAPALSDACLAATGGNPLLVRRLIEDTAGSGQPAPQTLRAGHRFEQAVLDCLYRCGPYVRTVARQMAVLNDLRYAPLLTRLADVDPQSLSLALGALQEAGILVDGTWRHPGARAAVLHDMTAEERADLHTRIGTLLFKNGAPVTAVAHHLISASRIDNDCAAAVLLEAAEHGLTDGDTALAFNCLSVAHQYGTSEEHRATTTAMLFRTEWRTDPRTAARRVPALLEAARSGRLSGRHVSAPIDSLLWFGRPDTALDTLEQMEQHAWRRQDAEASASLQISRAQLTLLYPTTLYGDDAPSVPAPGGDSLRWASSRTQALSELLQVMRDGPSPLSALAAEQTLVSHRLNDQTVLPLAAAIGILIAVGRFSSADRWIDRLDSTARSQSAPAWQALFGSLQAKLALRRGRPAAAVRLAEAALSGIPAASWGVMIALPLSVALEAHTLLGAHSTALAQLGVPTPDAMFQTPLGLQYLRSRGRVMVATGQTQAALEDFTAVGELATRWRMDIPALLPWRTDAARVHLARGETERARELAQEQLALVQPGQHQVRAVTLRALAATASAQERGRLLGQALEAVQQCDNPVELAYTLNDVGRCHQEAGQYSKGRMALRRARQLAEESGVPLPARTLPEAPRGQQPRAAVVASEDLAGKLSDAEMRVVSLAIRGHSNRQIAAKLFVTVSTVEQHLTRVYRKLGIKRRSDLTLALHGGDTARRAS